MSLRRIITLCVLALLSIGGVKAQVTSSPARAVLPWNQYVPSRIPDGYQSIIGQSGTTLVSGSNNGYYYSVYNISLPFPFYFIGQTYNQGYTLRVAPSGWMSFNGSSYTYSTYPYYLDYNTSTFYPYYNKLLMVYWADLQCAGVSGGGIYYRVDGSAPNRVLTVEWRVQGMYYPSGNPGNFQAKLYESNGNIEFHYGPNSIDRTKPSINPMYTFGYGAMVGIKNYGHQFNSQPPSGNDAEKFLIMCDPAELPDTVAITALPTIPYAGVYRCYPVYYAYYYSYVSPYAYYRPAPYFHYKFPTQDDQRISYRMSPVLNDVAADSVWFTPTRPASAYGVDASVTINARFRNMGGNSRQNIPVRADVYRNGGTLVASVTGTAFSNSTAQFGTSNVTFSTAISTPITSQTGEYTVKLYPEYSADQDHSNDTLNGRFFISKSNDLTPYAILQPFKNEAPLFTKYPVGVPVVIEVRYLNLGTRPQFNATVGYQVLDDSGSVLSSGTSTVPGTWESIGFRDIQFTWTPSTPGHYYVRAFTVLANDENRLNDTLPSTSAGKGSPFDVLYEVEVQAGSANLYPHFPQQGGSFPDGKPIPVRATFLNSGVSDATNVPATVIIRDAQGRVVYSRNVTITNIVGAGGQTVQDFPSFIPNGSGNYCVTAYANYPGEPIRGNDTAAWCFTVKPRLSGVIRVGYGERFKTIQEARDSLFTYGVSGPVAFELTDDSYIVEKSEPTIPALDFRGRIVGVSPTNTVTWRPATGKTDVVVNLRTASGIGIWYGQLDTSNPSGYVTWDGGANKALRFVFENIGTKDVAMPIYFGQGSSNYAVRNVKIQPVNAAAGKQQTTTISLPTFNQTFNRFSYVSDLSLLTSAGIMLRNSAPIDPITGTNSARIDTLSIQNNVFENNEISGFGYGIASVGSGPLFVVGQSKYVDYSNTNNTYRNNLITNVGRGGIVVAYEKGSEISGNTIRTVNNTSTVRGNAVGIWATAGGNSSNNRGYSTDLRVERNRVSDLTAASRIGEAVPLAAVNLH